jgi:hypothetical protein
VRGRGRAAVGRDNVVLGTDLPFDMAPHEPMADIDAALRDGAPMEQICEANPSECFGLS